MQEFATNKAGEVESQTQILVAQSAIEESAAQLNGSASAAVLRIPAESSLNVDGQDDWAELARAAQEQAEKDAEESTDQDKISFVELKRHI